MAKSIREALKSVLPGLKIPKAAGGQKSGSEKKVGHPAKGANWANEVAGVTPIPAQSAYVPSTCVFR